VGELEGEADLLPEEESEPEAEALAPEDRDAVGLPDKLLLQLED
jgi:hypothetical protein